MRPLPEFDFPERYDALSQRSPDVHNLSTADCLLLAKYNSGNPLTAKRAVVAIMQTYIDAAIDDAPRPEVLTILDGLTAAGALCVDALYRNEELGDMICALLRPLEEEILARAGKATPKRQHLSGEGVEVYTFGRRIPQQRFDAICAVASGGIEPALLASSVLGGLPVLLMRYSGQARLDTTVKLPHPAHGECAGKELLVVEDSTYEGRSMRQCMEYCHAHGARSVYATTVLGTPQQMTLANGLWRLDDEPLPRHVQPK
jgi:hypothetical protein